MLYIHILVCIVKLWMHLSIRMNTANKNNWRERMPVVETKYVYLKTLEKITKKWHRNVSKYNLIPSWENLNFKFIDRIHYIPEKTDEDLLHIKTLHMNYIQIYKVICVFKVIYSFLSGVCIYIHIYVYRHIHIYIYVTLNINISVNNKTYWPSHKNRENHIDKYFSRTTYLLTLFFS